MKQGAASRPRTERFLYVIGSGRRGAPLKIGVATDVEARIAFLQIGNPMPLKVLHRRKLPGSTVRKAESACHWQLRAKRVSGEWFRVSQKEAIATVREVVAGRVWEKLTKERAKKRRQERPNRGRCMTLHMKIDADIKHVAKRMADADGLSVSEWLRQLLARECVARA